MNSINGHFCYFWQFRHHKNLAAKKNVSLKNYLSPPILMFPFYTPWKYQKTRHFLMFSRRMEMEHWLKMCWYCEGSWAQPGPTQRPVTTLNLEAWGSEILKLTESSKGNIIVLQFKFQIWFCIFQICLWFCIKILFRTVLNYLIFPKSNSWQMGEFITWKSSINSTFHNKSVKNAYIPEASRMSE